MATEKLKVFVNTAPSVSTSAITNVVIKATSSSEQAVLKTISYEAVDPTYPVTVSVTNGNAALTTPKTTLTTVKNADNLSGSQIVDVSSTVGIKFDTGVDLTTVGYTDARYFAGNNTGIFRMHDTTSTDRVDGATLTYADSIGDFTGVRSGTSTRRANSAFGIILDANNTPASSPAIAAGDKVYFGVYSSQAKAYNAAGSLITWNTGGGNANNDSFDFTSVNGACTDGTYIYAIDTNNNSSLFRRTIVGNVESTITMSQNLYGQSQNQGGFTIYHDGYIYLHHQATENPLHKINVTTGAVTEISGCAVGSYSAGGILTKAVNGKFYIIEVGQYANDNNIIELETFTRVGIASASLSVSTEYGNLGIEIQPGVGLFFYNSVGIFVDVNSMTASTSTFSVSSFFGSNPGSFASNNDASSFANIPLHQTIGSTLPRAVTHKVYADGVLIEGVI